MREIIKHFVRVVAGTLPVGEPVYEFGSRQVAGQEGFADLRPYFPGKEYVGCDMEPGPGVDRIEDLEHLALPDDAVGTALVLETLEHVQRFWVAMQEVHRVLRPGGLVVISSLMNFAIHEFPQDYWRFTPQGFEVLLEQFPSRRVWFAGWSDFPHTIVGVGAKGPGQFEFPATFLAGMREWEEHWAKVHQRDFSLPLRGWDFVRRRAKRAWAALRRR